MALPFRNHLHVHAALDCARNEHATQRSVRKAREAETHARIAKRLARFGDRKQTRIVRLALAEFLNQ